MPFGISSINIYSFRHIVKKKIAFFHIFLLFLVDTQTLLEYWQRAKEVLDKKGEKWVWLSEQAGISQPTLSKMVNFDRYPDAHESGRICKALNVTNEYLLTGNDPVKPNLQGIIKELEDITEKLRDI
jgi:hypothetical protein